MSKATPRPRGYLVFTTHDMDEVDATFVPEDQTEILDLLRNHKDRKSDITIQEAFSKWIDKNPTLQWNTQTRCHFKWPFNNHEILGTFYHIVC